jgi:hypothetical protein
MIKGNMIKLSYNKTMAMRELNLKGIEKLCGNSHLIIVPSRLEVVVRDAFAFVPQIKEWFDIKLYHAFRFNRRISRHAMII